MKTGNLENKDLPAFACVGYDVMGGGYQQDGLTKREYFAVLSMQATDLEKYAETYGNKWAIEFHGEFSSLNKI